MRDFNVWQKLLMAVAVVVAVSFAMAMSQVEPVAGDAAAPRNGLIQPF